MNSIRVARAAEGREIILVRHPMGLEEYELDGRPDSRRDDSVSTTITPHNGQITASICLDPQRGDAGCQGGGLILKLIHVLYADVTFCDVTNNICFDMPTIDADVVPPVVIGGGHGH